MTRLPIPAFTEEGLLYPVGFSRPWDEVGGMFASIRGEPSQWNRTYKVVAIDDESGEVISVTNRDENK